MIFVLWCHQFIFQCPSTLKMYLDAILFSNVFKAFTKSLVVRNCGGTSVGNIVFVCSVVVSIWFFECSSSASLFVWPRKDICILLMLLLHMLILLFICSWLEQMMFALCIKEFITLYLLAIEWWLSHCKYWFVWVGFLYMKVDKLPSSSTATKVSRKGSDPSALVFSAVNWIFSSIPFKCWKNSSLYAVSRMTKVSSTNLFQRLGGVVLF